MGNFPFAVSAAGLAVQAATPVAGFALSTSSTPNIITWTAPNDGAQHRFIIMSAMVVTTGGSVTGGQVRVTWQTPDGSNASNTPYPGGSGAGVQLAGTSGAITGIVKAGATVTIVQFTSISGGTAVFWAEIWGE